VCAGLGLKWSVDPAKVVPDEGRSLLDGAIHPWQRHGPRLVREALEGVAERHGFSLETPFRDLPKKARQLLLEGDGNGCPGAVPYLRRRVEALLEVAAAAGEGARGGAASFQDLRPYLTEQPCPEREGARLGKERR